MLVVVAALGLGLAVIAGFVNSYAHPEHLSPAYIAPQIEQLAQPAQAARPAVSPAGQRPLPPPAEGAPATLTLAEPQPVPAAAPAPAPAAAAVPRPAARPIQIVKKRVPPTPGDGEGDHGGHD